VIEAIVDPEKLIRVSQLGGITLVLGSGLSVSKGLPNWDSLARDLWREAFPARRSPWQTKDGEAKSPLEVPQFLPIVFELAYHELKEEKFLKALHTNLYRNARLPTRDGRFLESDETLAVLARLVVQEFKREGNRRIERIVTLNADDLLEQAVSALVPTLMTSYGLWRDQQAQRFDVLVRFLSIIFTVTFRLRGTIPVTCLCLRIHNTGLPALPL
jgi:hypothetical protein